MPGGGGGKGNDGSNDMQVSGMEAAVSKEKGISTYADTRVSTSDGKSRKIGPDQSPKAIEKERQDYITQKKKTGEFSKETSKEYKEFAEAEIGKTQ